MYTPLSRLGAGVATPLLTPLGGGGMSSFVSPTSNIYSVVLGTAGGLAGQSSNVLAAFRDLKVRAKALESENKEIKRGSDEVRSQLSLSRREGFKFTKSPQEVKQMEGMMRLRKDTEERRRQVNELERDLMILEDSSRSLERSVTSARARLASLGDDTLQINSILREHEQAMTQLLEELQAREESCEQLSKHISALPKAKQLQISRMKEAVASMAREVQKVRSSSDQANLRSEGVSRYLEMMINVNGEICDTILAREEAKARVLRIAEKMPPPVHGGAGTDVLSAISHKHADAALQSETRRALADARSLLKMHTALYSNIAQETAEPAKTAKIPKTPKTAKTAKNSNSKKIDLLSNDVAAIVEQSRLFAKRTIAAANLHSSFTSPICETPRNTPIDIALSGGTKSSPVFVGGGKGGEFNAYANVSRSVRAAREWNSQIESHIRSIQHGGATDR